MKRIVCVIFAIGVCLISFADVKSKKQDEYSIISEKLTAYARQTDSISAMIKKYLDLGKEQQQKITTLEKKIDELEAHEQQTTDMITAATICDMLVEYPLMVRYDSVLIVHTLNLIDKYNIDTKKENVDLYKLKIPVIKKYKEYNQNIYDIISMVLYQYVEFGTDYSTNLLEQDLEKTSYYKNAYNKGINIPYIDNIIVELRSLIIESRLTPGNLKNLLSDLK